jgi:hypothetical protein
MTTTKEHVTAFFVVGIYYWLIGNDWFANNCFEEGVWILETVSFVGDA